MRRSYIALIFFVVATVLVVFPTPHTRTMEDLVKALDCSTVLVDGESLQESWTDMKAQTKIIVDIQSSEDVEVRLTGIRDITEGNPETFYDSTDKVHSITSIRDDVLIEIYLSNPSWYAEYVPPSWLGPSAFMSGSIEAYHGYEIQEWLPWWMP